MQLIQQYLLIHLLMISTNCKVWVKVMLDKTYLSNDFLSQSFDVESKFFCGAKCAEEQFCNTWCHDNNQCVMSSTVVSPKYVVSPDKNSAKCYTRNRRDLIPGSIPYCIVPVETPDAIIDLTANGVFLKGFGPVFEIKPYEDPWVLYDLRKTVTIYEIIISSSYTDYWCNNDIQVIEISVGDYWISNSNFSTYRAVVNAVDPCKSNDDLLHYKPLTSLQGQYLAILRRSLPGKMSLLSINYVEVDGE